MVAVPVTITQPDPRSTVLPTVRPTTASARATAQDLDEQLIRLPLRADDLQRDFGVSFYSYVALDPILRAGIRVLFTAACDRDPVLGVNAPRQRADAQANPDYDRASLYARFAQTVLARLPRSLRSYLYEMGTAAFIHGHKLSEAVWTDAKVLPNYGPQLVYADLQPKPLGTYQFVRRPSGETVGITPYDPAAVGPGRLVNGRLAGRETRVYAWDKFPTLTWDEQDRDPRGTSALRVVYGAWMQKRQAEPGLLAYLARFGQPSLKVILPPGLGDTVTVTVNDVATTYPTAEFFARKGEEYQAGGVGVWPAGTTADLEEAQGDGAAYINAMTFWDRQIVVGLLGQTLAMLEGQHRSGADAQQHADTLWLLVQFVKAWLAEFVSRWLVRPLIAANFGETALPFAPTVSLGQTDPANRTGLLQAFAQLAGPGNYWNRGVVPDDVGAQLDAMAGMPERQLTAVAADGTPTDAPPPPQAAAPPPPTGA